MRCRRRWANRSPACSARATSRARTRSRWARSAHFVERLRALHDALAVARSPASWRELLLQTLEAFLAPAGDEMDDLAELRDAIRELVAAMQRGGVGAQPLPLAVLRSALAQQLDDPAHGGVPTGGVTFTSMSSLRGLPFAVVCVIGLDDGAFPSARQASEFDLIALRPRRGDRQRRIDERNLFLDLLLAARHSLNLSYTGKSVRDNAPLPPSVLVSELLETLVPAIAADPASPASLAEARSRLVVEHPLQPFAAESFAVDGDPRLRSFDRELADALRRSLQAPLVAPAPVPEDVDDAAHDEDEGDDGDDLDDGDDVDDEVDRTATDLLPVFFGRALAAPGPPWREVSLDQLTEFFRNPCRYLLRRRLGIALVRSEDELQDDEPFVPDWPGRTALAARLLAPLLAGADAADVRRLALAGQEMPAGALGHRQLEIELEALGRFADRIRAATAAPCLPPYPVGLEFDLDGERWRLDAAFSDLRTPGLVRWRCDDLRPVDILAAWLPHLILCAAPPEGVTVQTRWLALDRTLQFAAAPDARLLLADLLRLYRRGLREPLAFYPKSAWCYVDSGGSLPAAGRVWTPTKDRPFAEGADPAYRLALRGRGDALAGEFATLAVSVFGPVANAMRSA
jgi:exodeoxyribonuclease V gamma subunit